MLYRVKFGDTERIGHDRTAGRTATRAHPNALASSPVDEVGDHQKVARITHVVDYTNFVFRLGYAIFWNLATETSVKPCENFFLKPRIFGLTGRHFEAWHKFFFTLFKLNIATLGDRQCVVASLWIIFEKFAHLGGRL